MIKYLIVISLFISCTADCQIRRGAINVASQFAGKTIVGFGNSILLGTYATNIDSAWFTKFCLSKGAIGTNNGVNGQTTTSNGCGGSVLSKTSIPVYSASYGALFIASSDNDIGFNGVIDTASFRTAYNDFVSYAVTTKGWPASKVYCFSPYFLYSYAAFVGSCGGSITVAASFARVGYFKNIVNQIANNYGVNFINIFDPMSYMDTSYFYSDQLHLNDKGHRTLANYLIGLLR